MHVPFANFPPFHVVGAGVQWLWTKNKKAAVAAVVILGAVQVHRFIAYRNARKRWDNAGKDVVVLHSIRRGKFCPNISPFVLKLETFLRMAKIPYELDYSYPFGPKDKTPWITLNGQDTGDSQLIIDMLTVRFSKDVNTGLSDEKKAIGRAMAVMTDEHLLWGLAIWRFLEDKEQHFWRLMKWPLVMKAIFPVVKRRIQNCSWGQGIGRHSTLEITDIMRKDLKAISNYLGQKSFLMGDEPCEFDCTVFGMVAQIKWCSPNSPYLFMMDTEFQNLHNYCNRMKERFWPDWDLCLDH